MNTTNHDDTCRKLTRREVLALGAGAAGGLATSSPALGFEATGELSSASRTAQLSQGSKSPNFVFFLGEGLRADEFSSSVLKGWDADGLSAMGNRILSTPHLDRVGREGIVFRNAFVVNALCLPSRASLLTGLYSHSTGCIDNRDREIPEEVPTLVGLLRDAGYEVAFFGKAHIHGTHLWNWDYYLGIEAAGANYYRPVLTESEHGVAQPPRTYHGYVDDILTEHALAWLSRKHTRPFCLFLWFIAPHDPFYRPRRYLDLYNGAAIPKPITFDSDLKGYPGKPRAFKEAYNKIGTTVLGDDDPRSLEELVKDHYAGVVTNDDCVRRVFEALEQMRVLDHTAVLLSSDHGYFLGEWRFYDKRFMHEPSIRVPLMIRYPRLVKPGTVVEKMALNLDITPTVLEIADLKIPERMHGQSLVPFLQGSEPARWRKDWLYEYYEYPGENEVRPHRGVRTERYKLIHYYLEPEEFELYDLQEDPGELHNLYGTAAHAPLFAGLRDRLAELRRETGDTLNF